MESGRVQAAREAAQLLHEHRYRRGVAILRAVRSDATRVDDDCDEHLVARRHRSRIAQKVAVGRRGDPIGVGVGVFDGEALVVAPASGCSPLADTDRRDRTALDTAGAESVAPQLHETVLLSVFEEGEAEAVIAGESFRVRAGQVVLVPAGTRHNFINRGSDPLRLWTVYAPPEHRPGTVHHTKAEADAAEEAH